MMTGKCISKYFGITVSTRVLSYFRKYNANLWGTLNEYFLDTCPRAYFKNKKINIYIETDIIIDAGDGTAVV